MAFTVASGSFVTLKTKGQAECLGLWDSMQRTVLGWFHFSLGLVILCIFISFLYFYFTLIYLYFSFSFSKTSIQT